MNGATNSNRRSCEFLEYPNSSLCVGETGHAFDTNIFLGIARLMREGTAVARIVLLHKHSD